MMEAMASQITGVSVVYSNVCSDSDKKKSNHSVTGLYERNSPVTGEFPAQRDSNAENASIWWRHHKIKRPQWFPTFSRLARRKFVQHISGIV